MSNDVPELDGAVDALKAAVRQIEKELASEKAELEKRQAIKRARLSALRRSLKAAEQAASPRIKPFSRPGRKAAA